MFNVTMSLPEVIVAPTQRLNFSMNFVPTTPDWEALELDFKIDDAGFVSPFPSYIQMPMPDNPFPSYLTYDKTTELTAVVNNIGNDGIFYVYPGTRAMFNGTGGAYASFIHYVNGSTSDYQVFEDRDSIHIPSGEISQLYFYSHPTDHPCQGAGTGCPAATIIPNGDYDLSLWVNGYSDQGESFGRTVNMGTVRVE